MPTRAKFRARIKRIHVNKHVIRSNTQGGNEPPLRVKYGGKNHKGREVIVHGPSTVIYRPHKPLSCGARAWIETRAKVTIDGVDLD